MNIIDSYKVVVLQAVDNFIDLKSIAKDKEKRKIFFSVSNSN